VIIKDILILCEFSRHIWMRWFFGPGPWHGFRWITRGDMRILVLEALADGPKRGYEVIKAIRDRFHGLYSPSPGAVYPTLQLLEDEGLVASEVLDGKRVYRITDEGRRFLEERKDRARELLEKGRKVMGAEAAELMDAARSLALTVFQAYATLPPERLLEVAEVLREARVKVLRVIGGGGSG